jgi:uncharacterized caspase-like protein/predicted negative regulator of RcsB-dependent stress response
MFRQFLKAISIVSVVLAASAGAGAAAGRVALVVGNSAYQSLATLANPSADAGELARVLSANGFEVLSCDDQRPGCFDLTREGLQDAIETLTHKAKGKDLALMFFSGHGMEGADGNVLAPIDMRVDCAENMVRRGVLLNDMLKAVAGARQKIVILDACRGNPLPQCPGARGFVAVSFGALSVPDVESFLLVSSTKPGQVALDGMPGEHSPFARALLYWLDKSPDIYFNQLFSHVAKMVIEDTTRAKFTQVPEMLVQGVPPEACLKGQGCSADPQDAELRAELETLKALRARDQDLMQIATAYLRKVGIRSVGKPLSEAEKQRVLDGIEDAGRALAIRGDDLGERALQRLNEGDSAEAERLFAEVLETEAREASERKSKAAEAARHLAALFKPKDVIKAMSFYGRAVELDPENAQSWLDYGDTALDAGDTGAAMRAFESAVGHARSDDAILLRAKANYRLGDVAMDRGNLLTARRFYDTALTIIEPSLKVASENRAAQRELSVVRGRIGDVLLTHGKLEEALAAYKASLAIADRLAKSSPDNIDWQLDLSAAHADIGDALIEIGNVAEALVAYKASLTIADKLAKSDPGNTDWQDRLSAAHANIGDVLLTQGKLEEALATYKASLGIADLLAISDPGNAGWQHDLSHSYNRIGDVLLAQDNFAAALEAYRTDFAITDRLAKADPDNSSWQRDLSISHEKIGNSLVISGQLQEAEAAHRRSLEISEKIAGKDPSNAESQSDLAEGLFMLVLTEVVTATGAPAQIEKTFANYIKLDLIDNPDSICRRADLIRELFKQAKLGAQPRKWLTRGRDILHKQATASQSARQEYLTVIIESALSASGDSGRPNRAHLRAELTCTQAASFARRRRVTVPNWRGEVWQR